MTLGLDQVFANLGGAAEALSTLLVGSDSFPVGVSQVVGLYLSGKGILMFRSVGEGQVTLMSALILVIVGAALISDHQLMSEVGYSLLGTDPESNAASTSALFSRIQSSTGGYTRAGLTGVFMFMALVGNIAFFRGLLMFRAVSDGKESFGKALTHVMGGVALVNMGATVSLLALA